MPGDGPVWLHTFEPFTIHHVLVLAVSAAIMGALIGVGRHWRGTGRERIWRRAWGAGIILTQTWTITWWLLPGNWNPGASLPLHICDLAVWVGAVALLAPSRLAACIIYFWGLGLSSQAFFTPTLQQGFGEMEYWLFWVQHTQLVGVALYIVIVDGFRPTLRDLGAITLATLAYGVVMLAINVPLGLNYGYIGNAEPEHETVIQRLGPWPLRLIWMGLIVETVFVIMWAIWPLWLRLRNRMRPAPAEPQ